MTMRRTALRTTPLALCALLGITAAAFVHTALRSSSPSADERLTEAPSMVRLRFTSAVDPRLARVTIARADSSPVHVDSLREGDASDEILAPILDPLYSGEFTVSWQVVGTDGHPVRGRFAFVVDLPVDSTALMPTAANPELGVLDPGTAGDPEGAVDPGRDGESVSAVQSPGDVAVRWLTFATILTIIGATVFRSLVLDSARNRATAPTGSAADDAAARAARLGRGAAGFLLLAAGARVLLQARAVDTGLGGDVMTVMLFDTPWGWGWLLQVAAAALALVAFHRAGGNPRSGWGAAMLAGLVLAFTPALSGHAVATESAPILGVAVDGVHVLAASAWIGTLLVLLAAGVPAATRGGGGTAMVADLVAVFSPLALAFAALVVGSGVISAVLHFDVFSQLWTTTYGRTLLLKIGAVVLVIAVGLYNWRAVRPRLAHTGPGRFRRSAPLELLAAAIVLALTAVLVATPTP